VSGRGDHMLPGEDGWYRVDVPVRFRDLDPMGHAHHTLPLIYLEEARASFWRELKGSGSLEAIDYIMAEVTLRFHARIRFPSVVTVGLAVRSTGTKSFTTDFELRDAAGVLLSSGSAAQVAYDYEAARTRPLSEDERRGLLAWQHAREAHEKKSAIMADTMPMTPPST
jgi:acyl-CoA thioester hydrolase